jgi:hypothetical protein
VLRIMRDRKAQNIEVQLPERRERQARRTGREV